MDGANVAFGTIPRLCFTVMVPKMVCILFYYFLLIFLQNPLSLKNKIFKGKSIYVPI